MTQATSNSANHEARKVNCIKLYINGELFATLSSYDKAYLILELLQGQAQRSGLPLDTHAIKTAYIPGIED